MNKQNVEILYEDNHIIVVVKAPGILSQGDNTNDLDMLSLIKDYIKEKYQKPGNVYLGLVHRLDRMTGGVMVFAKTSKAAARLSEQIREHLFEKRYLAIVNGQVEPLSGSLYDKIEIDTKTGISKISNGGKEAKLDYLVMQQEGNYSLVDILLKTGRHHQIRVQFASRNNPLYGDMLYGIGPKDTLGLYAYNLAFYHPITKEQMIFEKKPSFGIWELFQLQKK